jgi:hypothetical protein
MTPTVIDCAVVGGLLLLSLLAGIFRRRIFRPVENWMVRGEAWSILSDPGEEDN